MNKIMPATINTIMEPANNVIATNTRLALTFTEILSTKIEATYVIRAIPARILPGTKRFKPFCFNVIYAKKAVMQSVIIQRTIISSPLTSLFFLLYMTLRSYRKI